MEGLLRLRFGDFNSGYGLCEIERKSDADVVGA